MSREDISFQQYAKVLRKRRWAATTIFAAVVGLSLAVTLFMTPVYKATAQVYVDPGQTAQLNFQQTQYQSDTSVYIETQIGILRSESIASKVIADLGLFGETESHGIIGVLKGMVGFVFSAFEGPLDTASAEKVKIDKFEDRLDVSAVKNSNLIKVSFEAEDRELAARVANATVQTFIERNLEMKVAPAREAMTWLNDKVEEIRGKMSKSASELQDYKREKELIVTGDKQSNISLQALTELSTRVLEAEARRYEAEVKYQQVKSIGDDIDKLMSLPSVMNNTIIQSLKTQHSTLNKDIAEMSKKLGDKHPQMIRTRRELEITDEQLRREINLIVNSLKTDYETTLKQEQSLKNALARQKQEAMNYESRSSEYELMRQDVESSKDIYDAVLKRFQESNLMGNISMSNVQFIDHAIPPLDPDRPKGALYILIGVIMGGFLAVGGAFGLEYMDSTFKSPDDIEDYLGLPFLGMVPSVPALMEKKGHQNLIAVTDPKSAVSEAIRSIRGSILLSSGDKTPKVIQVCSAVHSEGKSTISSNLACIMSAAGEKVLLVDGDMRKPRLHRVFKTPNGKGLSSLLIRQDTLDDVVHRTSVANLSFLPSGPVSPNPAELLGSKTMQELLVTLRGQYDRVIIDCPPYLGLADASMLTPVTDGTILVVKGGETPRDVVQKATKGMALIKAKVLGIVLNAQTGDASDYYAYNYNYYHTDADKTGTE